MNEKVISNKSRICNLFKPLLIKALFDNLGGEFDLMSRRMVSANNKVIAKRIIKEIEIFPAERDDAPVQKK